MVCCVAVLNEVHTVFCEDLEKALSLKNVSFSSIYPSYFCSIYPSYFCSSLHIYIIFFNITSYSKGLILAGQWVQFLLGVS